MSYEVTLGPNAADYRASFNELGREVEHAISLPVNTDLAGGANVLEMRGEYVPRGLTDDQRIDYGEAVHVYKDAYGIPPNVDVPKWILDKLAQLIKDGLSPRDAAYEAPEPPEPDIDELDDGGE